MRPIILKCPSCDGNLTVARLDCPDCKISIEGEFTPPALLKLTGAQIDFVDSLMGGGFTVVNPNAVKSCSCGQSFDTTFGGGAAKPCS